MISVTKHAKQTTREWAGGTTTQLGIFPIKGDYATRDFEWRISTAKITAPESPFTQLPGVKRDLMVLDGNLTLDFEDGEQVNLSTFEKCHFDGGRNIIGKGLVTDFNLMIKGEWGGALQHDCITSETTLASIGEYLGIYVVNGTHTLLGETLAAEDFALIQDEETVHIEGDGDIVIAYLWREEN